MGVSQKSADDYGLVVKFNSDLCTLASHAASELDSLGIGLGDEPGFNLTLESVKKFRDALKGINLANSSDISTQSPATHKALLHPSAVVVMNQVITVLKGKSPQKLNELITTISIYISSLDEVLKQPEAFKEKKPDELNELIDFCLTFSEELFAYQKSSLNLKILMKSQA